MVCTNRQFYHNSYFVIRNSYLFHNTHYDKKMNIIITKNYEELSTIAADILADIITKKPNATLGLATGGTPLGLYKNLIAKHKAGKLDFSEISSVNLDEYVGLDGTHNQSYRFFMNQNLFSSINIDEKNTHVPNGASPCAEAECAKYNDLLTKITIDLQILGIGGNGHIGFNEPGTSFDSTTHTVVLKEETRRDNARFFNSIDEVPTHAITMGISNIMAAKHILILASGEGKAQAIYDMVKVTPTENCPASALQNHPNVTVIVDLAAAKLLG